MSNIAYSGMSEKNSSAMCHLWMNNKYDEYEAFYDKHKKAIHKSVFKDSLCLQKSWKILAEHLRLSQKNVTFMLKNQMKGADNIYIFIKNFYDAHQSRENDLYVYNVFAMGKGRDYATFFEDTTHTIILPYLYKIHIFSPLITFLIFIDLVYALFEMYLDCSLRHKSKSILSDYTTLLPCLHRDFTESIGSTHRGESSKLSYIPLILRASILDELEMHKNML